MHVAGQHGTALVGQRQGGKLDPQPVLPRQQPRVPGFTRLPTGCKHVEARIPEMTEFVRDPLPLLQQAPAGVVATP